MEEKHRTGEFLKELRKEKGYTQEQLANKIHVTNKAISNWEKGRSRPDPEIMITLAKFFDVTIDELYAGARRDEKDIIFKRKLKKIFIGIGISIFAILFLLLLTYFILTIESVKFYMLYIEDSSVEINGGYYIVNKGKSILHLNKLELDSDMEDNAYIELYEKNFDENRVLFSDFSSDFDLWNKIIDNVDEVYLKVVYIKENESIENTYKIAFYPKYLNHKFVNLTSETSNDINNDPTNNTELIDKLLELGFKEQSENLYFKEEKNKNEKKITYVDANIYTYTKKVESKDSKKIIAYYQDSDTLDVQYLDNKETIYKEYRYDLKIEVLNCKIGRCNDTEDIASLKEDIEIVKLFK